MLKDFYIVWVLLVFSSVYFPHEIPEYFINNLSKSYTSHNPAFVQACCLFWNMTQLNFKLISN